MNRLSAATRALLFFPTLVFAAARAQQPLYVSVSAPLAIDQKTAIPGHVLEPGDYSIRIIDRLKDRFILQVEDSAGKPLSTFIGLHNAEFDPFVTLKHQGPIFWTAAPKGEKAIRGFSFPNGNTLELVYPKAEAVTLAKLNTNSVPAIDPVSEGRKPDPKLSPEDREVVTLWMLTATRIGPKNDTPAIAAKRFVAPAEGSEAADSTVASAPASAPPAQARQDHPAPVQIAKAEAPPRIHSAVKKLPQTGSELPLSLLLAILSLSGAAAIRLTRSQS